MIKKILRIAVLHLALLSFLVCSVFLLFRIVFTPHRVNTMVTTAVRGYYNRELSIGRVSYGLRSGILLEDIWLSAVPDRRSGVFVELKRLHLAVKPQYLVRRMLVFNRVTCVSLRVYNNRGTGGHNTIASFFSDYCHAGEPARSERRWRPYPILIKSLLLNDCSVLVQDGITTRTFNLEGALRIESGEESHEVLLQRLSCHAAGETIVLSGNVRHVVTPRECIFNVSLRGSGTALKAITEILPAKAPITALLAALSREPSIDTRISGTGENPRVEQ